MRATAQMEVLLDIVKQKPPETFDVFVETLAENHQQIHQKLTSSEEESKYFKTN